MLPAINHQVHVSMGTPVMFLIAASQQAQQLMLQVSEIYRQQNKRISTFHCHFIHMLYIV